MVVLRSQLIDLYSYLNAIFIYDRLCNFYVSAGVPRFCNAAEERYTGIYWLSLQAATDSDFPIAVLPYSTEPRGTLHEDTGSHLKDFLLALTYCLLPKCEELGALCCILPLDVPWLGV